MMKNEGFHPHSGVARTSYGPRTIEGCRASSFCMNSGGSVLPAVLMAVVLLVLAVGVWKLSQ
jgi:hypothetical protein